MPPRPRQNRQAYSKVAKDWLQSQKLHRIRMGCRNICCSKEDQWGIRWGRQKRLEFFRRSEGYAGQQRRGKQQWTGYADADPTSTRHELTACAGSCQSSRMRRPFDGEHGLPLRIFFHYYDTNTLQIISRILSRIYFLLLFNVQVRLFFCKYQFSTEWYPM